jgi:hypothetical protein
MTLGFVYIKGCGQVFRIVALRQHPGFEEEATLSSSNYTDADIDIINKLANRSHVSNLAYTYGTFQMSNNTDGHLTVDIHIKHLTDKPYGTEMGSALYL